MCYKGGGGKHKARGRGAPPTPPSPPPPWVAGLGGLPGGLRGCGVLQGRMEGGGRLFKARHAAYTRLGEERQPPPPPHPYTGVGPHPHHRQGLAVREFNINKVRA